MIGKAGQILVGAAAVVLDDGHQPPACRQQALVDRLGFAVGRRFFVDGRLIPGVQAAVFDQIVPGPVIGGGGGEVCWGK